MRNYTEMQGDCSFELWFCSLTLKQQVFYRLTGCLNFFEYLKKIFSKNDMCGLEIKKTEQGALPF